MESDSNPNSPASNPQSSQSSPNIQPQTSSALQTLSSLPTPSQLPQHLNPSIREIHVIVSRLSGRHNALQYHRENLIPFLHSLYNIPPNTETDKYYRTHITTSAESINTLTRHVFLFNARKGVKQTLILLSGDGGVVDIVNTLASSLISEFENDDGSSGGYVREASVFVKPIICLIPMGTANALAWSSGVASDPLGTILKGRPTPIPMFEVRFSPGSKLVSDEGKGREDISAASADPTTDTPTTPRIYGAVVFSWGLHASLVAMSDTQEYRKHGIERFRMAAEKLLEENHRYRADVKIRTSSHDQDQDQNRDQNRWEPLYNNNDPKTHAYLLATLVSNLEQTFRISPSSAKNPLDGTLRLIAFQPLDPPTETMRILGLAYQGGKHVEETDKVVYREIDSLRIEFEEEDEIWRQVCIDGKIVVVDQGGWVEVRRVPLQGRDGRKVVELVR